MKGESVSMACGVFFVAHYAMRLGCGPFRFWGMDAMNLLIMLPIVIRAWQSRAVFLSTWRELWLLRAFRVIAAGMVALGLLSGGLISSAQSGS